jgi:hypothetical protein
MLMINNYFYSAESQAGLQASAGPLATHDMPLAGDMGVGWSKLRSLLLRGKTRRICNW